MSSELLAVLLGFQPSEFKQKREYDAAARSFVSQLNNVSATHFLKGADTPQDILSVLDPTENSIAYAFILRHRITALIDKKTVPESARPGGALWNKVVLFLEEFDPVQMRYAGAEWRRLVDLIEQIARTMGTPGIAIAPIRSALTRLDPTTGAFTLAHLSFIRLCMETRSYVAATPILDNYIHSIASHIPAAARESLEYSVACAETATSGEYVHQHSGHTEKVTPADIQEYYILGAMAYLGVRQFKKAQHFLEHALVVPSNNVANGSMLEAYKKWVLVSCLVDGSAKAPPRTANVQAMKQVKVAAKAYEALAEAFAQTTNFPKLRAQIAAGKDIWVEDGNGGLVKELQESQHRFYVSRLSRTFSAIPVSNIAVNMGGSTEEVTDYLETLIRDGHLNARIERPNKLEAGIVLRFFLDPAQGPLAKSEKQQQQALFEQTTRTNVLAEQVKDADYRLTLTKEYIDNVKRQNKKQSQGGDTMDVSWDDHVDLEEDIMDDRH